MPQVSSLHLGSVSTHSRGVCPPPSFSSIVRAAPSSYWALSWSIMVHHHAGSTTILMPEDQRNLSRLSLYSFFSCLFFHLSHPSLHTPGQTMHPSLPCPPACLLYLSGNCLTLPQQHPKTIQMYRNQQNWQAS